jgi:Rad3-related DNA helicase
MGFFGDSDSDDEAKPIVSKVNDGGDEDTLDDFMSKLAEEKPSDSKKKTKSERLDLEDDNDFCGAESKSATEDRSCNTKGSLLEVQEDDKEDDQGGSTFTLMRVNHAEVRYEEFTRSFTASSAATPPKILSDWSIANSCVIRVRNNQPLPPFPLLRSFTSLPSPALKEVASHLASTYPAPTAIQSVAVPLALSGNNVIACAQTGSGKTLSFAIPMMAHLTGGKTRGIVVGCTRELVMQIYKVIKPLAALMNRSSIPLFGGNGGKEKFR